MTFNDINKKHFSSPQPFECPFCGHDEACYDSFAQIPSVKRFVPGNLCCAKCGKAVPCIPAIAEPDKG